MQEIVWNYDWERRSEAHRKMLDFFLAAERMPTTGHGDQCRWGT